MTWCCVICVVNLGAEPKRFTHTGWKYWHDVNSSRGRGMGVISLIKDVRQVQNRGQAKITKFQYKWCYSSESISLCIKTIHLWQLPPQCPCTVQKLNTYLKMVSFSVNGFQQKTPVLFCHSCEGYNTVIFTNSKKRLHSILNEFDTN